MGVYFMSRHNELNKYLQLFVFQSYLKKVFKKKKSIQPLGQPPKDLMHLGNLPIGLEAFPVASGAIISHWWACFLLSRKQCASEWGGEQAERKARSGLFRSTVDGAVEICG